jgi:hypothetical protein
MRKLLAPAGRWWNHFSLGARAQVKRKRPAAEDDFRIDEEAIAFLAASRACGAWHQVAGRCEGRPRFTNFAVIPASGVSQLDSGINSLNLRSILCAVGIVISTSSPVSRRAASK